MHLFLTLKTVVSHYNIRSAKSLDENFFRHMYFSIRRLHKFLKLFCSIKNCQKIEKVLHYFL